MNPLSGRYCLNTEPKEQHTRKLSGKRTANE